MLVNKYHTRSTYQRHLWIEIESNNLHEGFFSLCSTSELYYPIAVYQGFKPWPLAELQVYYHYTISTISKILRSRRESNPLSLFRHGVTIRCTCRYAPRPYINKKPRLVSRGFHLSYILYINFMT